MQDADGQNRRGALDLRGPGLSRRGARARVAARLRARDGTSGSPTTTRCAPSAP
jgi:hypothetical protein